MPPSPSSAGRLATNNDSKSPKRKPHVRRVWSLGDEIAILKGMVELTDTRGPVKWDKTAVGDLHSLVSSSLSMEVTESRLAEKIRKLKRKYSALVKKREDGKIVRGHDQSVFELAQKVWGSEVVVNAMGKPMKKKKRRRRRRRGVTESNGNEVTVKGGENSLKREYPHVVAMVGSRSAALVNPEEVMTLERHLEKVRTMEIKHLRDKLELLGKSLELVGEGIHSSIRRS